MVWEGFLAPTPSVRQPLFETSEFVPGFHTVCPWDKSGEKYKDKLILHSGSPISPGLSLGQSRGRRAAQKVYVKKVYVPFSLANVEPHFSRYQVLAQKSLWSHFRGSRRDCETSFIGMVL